jgi:sugar phosphate isomerase/epimerase
MIERRVQWAATVRTKQLQERVASAAAVGFTHLTLFPSDVSRWEDEGMPLTTMKSIMADGGVKLLAIDPYGQWIPDFSFPADYPEMLRAHFDFNEQDVFRMAEELGAEEVNVVEPIRGPWRRTYAPGALADAFGTFADRARSRGLVTTLEFMPISSVPDLSTAWDIVSSASRADAGICFDTWHFVRSNSSLELLAEIPGEQIIEIQLADGAEEPVDGDLIKDLLHFRDAPGDGSFPIAEIVSTLKHIGAYRSVGPEIFSDAYDAMSCDEAMSRAATSLDRWS